jgi:hypothetical protein
MKQMVGRKTECELSTQKQGTKLNQIERLKGIRYCEACK